MSSQGSGGIAAASGTDETHKRLQRWGVWSRVGGGAPASSSVFILGSTVPTPPMTDEEGLMIDGVVVNLAKRDSEMGEVVRMHYIKGMPDYLIAERWGCERKRVGRIRAAAVAWIDGALDSAERA